MKLISKGGQYYETADGKYWIQKYMGVWTVGDKEHDELTDFASFAEAKANLAKFLALIGA
jgi:hypothetical protein